MVLCVGFEVVLGKVFVIMDGKVVLVGEIVLEIEWFVKDGEVNV